MNRYLVKVEVPITEAPGLAAPPRLAPFEAALQAAVTAQGAHYDGYGTMSGLREYFLYTNEPFALLNTVKVVGRAHGVDVYPSIRESADWLRLMQEA